MRPRFIAEDIGYVTHPIDIEAWITTVQTRYQFLADLTAQEARWAECNPGHHHEVTAAIHKFQQAASHDDPGTEP